MRLTSTRYGAYEIRFREEGGVEIWQKDEFIDQAATYQQAIFLIQDWSYQP